MKRLSLAAALLTLLVPLVSRAATIEAGIEDSMAAQLKSVRAMQQFPPLEAGSSGNASGVDYSFSIISTVGTIETPPAGLLTEVDAFYKENGWTPPPASELTAYHYSYRIINKSQKTLQINFSGWEFIHSPFTNVIQGFQLVVPPGQTYRVSYFTIRPPKLRMSPVNAGLNTGKRFEYAGLGEAAFYCPDSIEAYFVTENGFSKTPQDGPLLKAKP